MSGLFNTLNIARKGLNAQQTALQTTSHNISNANTEGFSRQRVELKSDTPYGYPGVGQLGTGVKLEGVTRMVDGFLEAQIRNENSELNKYTTKSELMSQIETVFNEPSDSGVNSVMEKLFSAWRELSENPESLSAKSLVVENAKTFTDTLNRVASKLDEIKILISSNMENHLLDANSTVDQLKTLNKQIFEIASTGDSPNDLLDKRDILMKKLSGIAEFKESFDKWGRVNITIGAKDITAEGISDSITPLNISSGKIGGSLEALGEINTIINGINDFAKNMANMVNSVHNPEGKGTDFFKFDGDEIALNLKVNEDIENNEALVATGDNADSPAGDGSRALSIANLGKAKTPSGATLQGSYSNIVIKAGISAGNAANMADNHEAITSQLSNRRESISGVSIDEEVTNLIQFQRSFEANSRVISVLSEMLDTLINRTGV
jgi:flagellar hook-associated protein 1